MDEPATITLSSVLGDVSTVMEALLDAGTDLVNWIAANPLIYMWILAAFIIIAISLVKGFIRGV